MDTTTRRSNISQEKKNPSPITSPNSNGTNKLINSPLPISRSDPNNPYPTTFVQADTTTFKQVVQMLTGSVETAKQAASSRDPITTTTTTTPPTAPTQQSTRNFTIPPIKTAPIKKANSFKLYERRNSNNFKNSLMMINTFNSNNNSLFTTGVNISPRNYNNNIKKSTTEMMLLSPSMLDFPKLTLTSPVTPLNHEDPFNKSSPISSSIGNSSSSSSEEERAIAEKGFYLHPSPMSTPRDSEPKLLPLFPVTSPKVSGSA